MQNIGAITWASCAQSPLKAYFILLVDVSAVGNQQLQDLYPTSVSCHVRCSASILSRQKRTNYHRKRKRVVKGGTAHIPHDHCVRALTVDSIRFSARALSSSFTTPAWPCSDAFTSAVNPHLKLTRETGFENKLRNDHGNHMIHLIGLVDILCVCLQ